MSVELTWNDVARVHGILIFDEAKAIHQLDLCDLASAMGTEVSLDIGLCDLIGRSGSAWRSRKSIYAKGKVQVQVQAQAQAPKRRVTVRDV